MLNETRVGPQIAADGNTLVARAGRTGETVVGDAHARFYEAATRGLLFTLTLGATTTGVAAGNIVAAAAAASTQFALINPVASGKNLVLVRFGMGIVSGTPAGGPLFHCFIPNINSLTAASPGGIIRNNLLAGGPSSVATPWSLAAGSALTGSSQALVTHSAAAFTTTATAQASVGELNAVEMIDGIIVVPPGVAWVPAWSAAGTSVLNAYSITWEEVPV